MLQPADNIINIASPTLQPTGPVLHLIYVDDLSLLHVVPIGTTDDADSIAAVSDIVRLFACVLQRYVQERLPAKMSKVVEPTLQALPIIGMQVAASGLELRPCPDKMLALISATTACLTVGSATGRQLSQLIGSWTWFCLLRRPMLSLLRVV